MSLPTSAGRALLARLGFRRPETALRELPEGWSSDPRWHVLAEALGRTADPDGALVRLLALGAGVLELALDDPARATPLLAAVGFSEHLATLLGRLPDAAAELAGAGSAATPGDLRSFKDLGLLRIAGRDLAAPPTRGSFEATGRDLADLADACLARALDAAGASAGLAVMAMGKYGGRELNYASDIDVLFVSRGLDSDEADRQARSVMVAMNGPPTVFRVDADLRPDGRDGPLTRSLDAYEAYYRNRADFWEFQSLIKCRFAAGDPGLGADFLAMAQPFVWPERLAPEAIEQIRALKARVEREVERRGLVGRQVKLGPGGIRDAEFAVQLLQLVHGRHHPELRLAATLDALDLLGAEGFVAEDDAAALAEAYVFLRHAEHRLQLVGGRQTHTLPSKAAALEHLARGLGYRDGADRSALEAFQEDWRRTTAIVRQIHERLFYRPLLETFAAVPHLGPGLDVGEALERLAALGFDRPVPAREAIAGLTAGASRRAKVMRAVLPGLLAWLSETPDPDAGLDRLRDLGAGLDAFPHLLALLRDSPPVAELLCRVLGTGPVLAGLLARDPALVSALEERPVSVDREALVREAMSVVSRAASASLATGALRRFKDGEWLALAARGLSSPEPDVFVETSHRLSHLGDACLEAALALARAEQDARTGGPPSGGFAIVGMGRLGGQELNHSSDLDVIFVYETEGRCPDGSEGRLYHLDVAETLVRLLGSTPPIFKVDAELRPEGRKGPLVRSLEGCLRYYDHWAQAWEYLALTRARHAAGDEHVTLALLDHVAGRVYPERLSDDEIHHLRHVKARIERERVKAREDPRTQVKLGIGGLADIEFTVQLLQRQHGRAHPRIRTPNTLRGIEALRGEQLVTERDAEWLREAYLLLNRVRNHLFLLRGLATDVLPARDEDVERLARSLGYGRLSRSRLLEDYRRATRRSRRVCDRLFYGED